MLKLKSIVKIEYSIEVSKNKGNTKLLRYRARKQRDEKYEKKIQRPRDLNSTSKKTHFRKRNRKNMKESIKRKTAEIFSETDTVFPQK